MSASDDPASGKVALRRVLGFFPSVAFIIGIVIGTGIFVSPTGILRGVDGSVGWAFTIWITCAVIAMCGALTYTELASSFTKSGGEFIFIKEAFGPVLAFLRIWTLVAILGPASIAVQSLTVANYLITPFMGDCNKEDYYVPIRLVAACVMCKYRLLYFSPLPLPSPPPQPSFNQSDGLAHHLLSALCSNLRGAVTLKQANLHRITPKLSCYNYYVIHI